MGKDKIKEPEALNLGSILARPVINTNAIPHFALDETDIIQDADFDPEPEVEIVDNPEPAANTPGDGVSLSPADIAVIAVDMVDGLQQFAFTVVKRKMTFTEAELDLLPKLDVTRNTVYTVGSPEEIAQKKLRNYLETIKKLPFAKEEKARLEKATIVYANTVDLKVSPLTGLMMAFGSALGTRAVNVFME